MEISYGIFNIDFITLLTNRVTTKQKKLSLRNLTRNGSSSKILKLLQFFFLNICKIIAYNYRINYFWTLSAWAHLQKNK